MTSFKNSNPFIPDSGFVVVTYEAYTSNSLIIHWRCGKMFVNEPLHDYLIWKSILMNEVVYCKVHYREASISTRFCIYFTLQSQPLRKTLSKITFIFNALSFTQPEMTANVNKLISNDMNTCRYFQCHLIDFIIDY